MAVTVIAAVPLTPSLVALTAAEPMPMAVTSPLAPTVATAALSVVQAIMRPASTFPVASRATADSWVLPCTTRVADAGLTVTDATGGGGVTETDADPLAVPRLGVIGPRPALPPATPPEPQPAPPQPSPA